MVLAPGLGMLCLEVKAHRRVAHETPTAAGGSAATRPFRAARSSRPRTTCTRCWTCSGSDASAEADAIIAWSAVLFTHCEFRVPAVEWNELGGSRQPRLHRQPISALVARRARASTRGSCRSRRSTACPPKQECQAIASALRPRFEVIQPAAQRRVRARGGAARLHRGAVRGARRHGPLRPGDLRGTGRDWQDAARARGGAASVSTRERRVGLICFNRLLGQWLEAEAEPLRRARDGVDASPPDASSRRGTEVPREPTARLLRDRAARSWRSERLLDGDEPPLFDVLVIDEAQDILARTYLDFLDLVCDGGLAAGTLDDVR